MSRIAYVNGQYVPHADASVHVEDRGYQFADGVYEVWAIRSGELLDEEPHYDRLERSLRELRITPPMGRAALRIVVREVIRRNHVRNGLVYLQVTRGVAPRDHTFPKDAEPALVIIARALATVKKDVMAETGVGVITMPDIRWGRCDIKSVGLLPNVLAKQAAHEAGCYEAWLTDAEGRVTEASSSNAWIVTADGDLVTRPADQHILNGVTRRAVQRVARERGLNVVERSFSVEEAMRAREAFVTSSGGHVMPVVRIDDATIGNGRPGSVAEGLRAAYLAQS